MKNIFIIITFIYSSLYSFANHLEDISITKLKENNQIPQPNMKNNKIDNYDSEINLFFDYLDKVLAGTETKAENFYSITKSNEMDNLLYLIDLNKILNSYLETSIIFRTSKGTIVHVSASRTSNCPNLAKNCNEREKFLLILTTSKNETFFIRIMEIINLSFLMHGSKTVIIDDEEYTVKAFANVSTPQNSRLEIRGPSGVVINSRLDKLAESLALKGIDIRLSKDYKLAYGNEIVYTENGNIKFIENKLLLFFPVKNLLNYESSEYYIIKAKDIKSEGTVFPNMEPNYIFKIRKEFLEIYKR